MKLIQAYYTTNYPVDDGGNYYKPIFIPEDTPVQLPITLKAPDVSLGNKGLQFDWSREEWRTSDQDPTLNLLKELQSRIKVNNTAMLNLMNDQLEEDDSTEEAK